MDPFFSRVSDEALFLLMTQGDKFAQDLLIRRYEHLGNQLAIHYIRVTGLKGVLFQDCLETIHDTINKVFRYFRLNTNRFYQFAKDALNQAIIRLILQIRDDLERRKEIIDLDDYCFSNGTTYHELIKDDTALSASDLCDVNAFLENLSSTNSLKKRRIARIYLLHEAGYTLQEIADRVGGTIYEVRKIVNEIENLIEGLDIVVDYHFR